MTLTKGGHSGMVRRTRPQGCNCTPGNLEMLRCAIAHRSSMLRTPRNDGEYSFLLESILRHVAAGAVIFVRQELAGHRDLDPVTPGIGDALQRHVEIDRRHDA